METFSQTFGDARMLYKNRKLGIWPKEKGRFERLMKELGGVPIRDLPYEMPGKEPRGLSDGEIGRLLEVIRNAFP